MRGPRPKSGKSRPNNLHGHQFQMGKSIGLNPEKKKGELKRRAHDLKNQDASWGPLHGPTQGFNLFQKRPNWF